MSYLDFFDTVEMQKAEIIFCTNQCFFHQLRSRKFIRSFVSDESAKAIEVIDVTRVVTLYDVLEVIFDEKFRRP